MECSVHNIPGVPGALFIFNYDENRFNIQRCDECESFCDDKDAGEAVMQYLLEKGELV